MADGDSLAGNSSDEDFEWEEVYVPEQQLIHEDPNEQLELQLSGPVPRSNIEITLHTRAKKDDSKKQASAAVHAQRVLRTTSHKIHTVCLLANARVRNQWLNDDLLQARLLSMTPLPVQNGFAMIHKSRVPDSNKRGRLFEAAVTRLVEWWSGTFFEVAPTGHIRSRTFDEVQEELSQLHDPSDLEELGDDDSERIRSVDSLMKHALMQRGSKDVSAQLFTSLCRAMDIPARLVVSLQSVPWQSQVGKQAIKKGNSKGKGKAPQTPVDDHDDAKRLSEGSEMEEVHIPSSDSTGKVKEPTGGGTEKIKSVVRLRKSKSQSSSRRGSPMSGSGSLKPPDPTTTPPVFWTEVFSRADSRWLPVDPIRGIVNKRHVFDPAVSLSTSPSKPSAKQDNRMLYVIGLEEDGYGRDITARYARDYTAKVSKVQGVGAGPARGRREWWARVVQIITRPYRLQRDDLEDDELHTHQLTEGMPTTIAGFKDHPLYALARHLKREEVIDPPTELGKFRGEPVYPRSSVISLKTAENWLRQGRVVREGCQPMKMVKQRAVTISRQREVEVALERAKSEGHAGGEEVLQGLYARSQTELYKPEPIKNGKIPKNDFGNIDLYVSSMLPEGAVHIPFKGVAKIAKKLGFDYAEAVTGFEFKKRRAYPVLEGIVVAAENENVIVEAYLEAEQDAEEKARAKRLDQVCKRWVRLVQGLRIRDRLQQQYASNAEHTPQPWLDTQVAEVVGEEEPGGFLTTADDVVEPFYLPRDPHTYPTSSSVLGPPTGNIHTPGHGSLSDHQGAVTSEASRDLPHSRSGSVEMDAGGDFSSTVINGAPKTMQELAEDHWREVAAPHEGFPASGDPPPVEVTVQKKAKRVHQGSTNDRSQGPSPRPTRSSRKRTRKSSESSLDHDVEVSPPKRGRGPVTSNSSATSTRILRPRAQKSAVKIQEEQEMEEAYRRAIADEA